MIWTGKARAYQKLGGRYGGSVKLDGLLVPRHVFWEFIGEDGHPDVFAHFEVREGRPTCVELSVKSTRGGRGVMSRDLNSFNIDNFTANVFRQMATEVIAEAENGMTQLGSLGDDRSQWAADAAIRAAIEKPGRGAPDLELVARVYRANIEQSPVLAVQEALNLNSERTAARRIRQARDAGLLPPTTPGKRKG